MNFQNFSCRIKTFLPFLFIIGLFFAIISPEFLTEGMFVDGLLYANISNNLANGYGSFWNPFCDMVYSTEFHGHPPLAMGILSIFYQFLGDSVLVEKIYSVATFIIAGIIIICIWREFDRKLKDSWFALLCWTSIPLITWAATNNLLENTMGIFVLISVFFYIKSIKKLRFLYIFLAGFSLFLAFLAKGITGLFPLSFPIFYFIFIRKTSFLHALSDTILLILSLIIPAIILFLVSDIAFNSISKYVNLQIVGSLADGIKTVDNRFYIIYRLLLELIPALVIVTVSYIVTCIQKTHKQIELKPHLRNILLFVALGLSGVVPMMISEKQSGFYIITALPFFAISFGILLCCIVEKINIGRKVHIVLSALSVLVVVVAITLNVQYFGTIGRNKEMLTDVHTILPLVEKDATINIDKSMWEEYSLRFYFARYKNINLFVGKNEKYLLIPSAKECNNENYTLLQKLNKYDLYIKK